MPVVEWPDHATIVFVTVCAKKRKSIFARADVHALILDTWKHADAWLVGRYVIMPDHIHVFCTPGRWDSPELKRWVQYWKARASKIWPRPAEHPVWQKSFWDTQLRRDESYSAKWNYVWNNPIRAGLCVSPDDWQFQGEMNVLPWHN